MLATYVVLGSYLNLENNAGKVSGAEPWVGLPAQYVPFSGTHNDERYRSVFGDWGALRRHGSHLFVREEKPLTITLGLPARTSYIGLRSANSSALSLRTSCGEPTYVNHRATLGAIEPRCKPPPRIIVPHPTDTIRNGVCDTIRKFNRIVVIHRPMMPR